MIQDWAMDHSKIGPDKKNSIFERHDAPGAFRQSGNYKHYNISHSFPFSVRKPTLVRLFYTCQKHINRLWGSQVDHRLLS